MIEPGLDDAEKAQFRRIYVDSLGHQPGIHRRLRLRDTPAFRFVSPQRNLCPGLSLHYLIRMGSSGSGTFQEVELTVCTIGPDNELEARRLFRNHLVRSTLLKLDGDALIILLYAIRRKRGAKLDRSSQLLNGVSKDKLVAPLSK